MAAEKEKDKNDDAILGIVSKEKRQAMKNRLGLLIYGWCRYEYGFPDTLIEIPTDIMNLIALFAEPDPEHEKKALHQLKRIAAQMDIDFKEFELIFHKHHSWWAWYRSDQYQHDLDTLLKKNQIKREYDAETLKKDQSFLAKIFKK